MGRLRALTGALLLALAIAGCGGGDDEKVQDLLSRAFAKPIGSADVAIEIEAKVEGIEEIKEPIRLGLRGPYKSNGEGKLPSFDMRGDIASGGARPTFSFGVGSTGDNAWITIDDVSYELGEETVAQLNRQAAEDAKKRQGSSLKQLGIDPYEWLDDPSEEGDAEVAGAETTRVTANLDVVKMLEDLSESARKSAAAQQAAPQAPELTDKLKKDIEEVVQDPKVDVYVAKEGETVRRLSADLDLDVPEEDRSKVGGIEGGRLSFSIEFSNVGQAKTIQEPKNMRPFSEFQGLLPQALPQQGGSQGDSGSGSGGGGAGDAEKFQRYSECIEKAGADDPQAIDKCSELLR